jgi:hypothetical protein
MVMRKCWLPWLLTAVLWGQDQTPTQTPAPPTPTSAPQNQSPDHSADRTTDNGTSQAQKKSNNRLFFTLPNFLTVENAGNVPPLTAWGKFKLTAQDSFDPAQFVWYGALAGIGQAENSDHAYGQGAEGYGKRYGENFGDGTIENFMGHALLPSILHQDPRYYQLGKGGIWHRTGYAVSRIFITRSDAGTTQFNASEFFGSAAAAGISTYTYHPRDERSVSNALSVWGAQVGYDALGFVAKEFWPDIRRKIHKSKSDQAP